MPSELTYTLLSLLPRGFCRQPTVIFLQRCFEISPFARLLPQLLCLQPPLCTMPVTFALSTPLYLVSKHPPSHITAHVFANGNASQVMQQVLGGGQETRPVDFDQFVKVSTDTVFLCPNPTVGQALEAVNFRRAPSRFPWQVVLVGPEELSTGQGAQLCLSRPLDNEWSHLEYKP